MQLVRITSRFEELPDLYTFECRACGLSHIETAWTGPSERNSFRDLVCYCSAAPNADRATYPLGFAGAEQGYSTTDFLISNRRLPSDILSGAGLRRKRQCTSRRMSPARLGTRSA